MARRDQKFELSPLAAAIVEAMPNRKRQREIKAMFKLGKCPVSNLWPTKQDVERWYRERGLKVKGV